MLTLKLARSQMQHKKSLGFCVPVWLLQFLSLTISSVLTVSPQKDSVQSPHHTSIEFLLPLMPYFVMGLWLYRQI